MKKMEKFEQLYKSLIKESTEEDRTLLSEEDDEEAPTDKKDDSTEGGDASTEGGDDSAEESLGKPEKVNDIKKIEEIINRLTEHKNTRGKCEGAFRYTTGPKTGKPWNNAYVNRERDKWIARWNELTGKDWKKIKEAEEAEAKRTGPYNPKEYPREVSRKQGLLKKDERRIIIRQLEHMSSKQNIDHDIAVAKKKIEKINQKLRRGEKVTVEERKFIRALRNII